MYLRRRRKLRVVSAVIIVLALGFFLFGCADRKATQVRNSPAAGGEEYPLTVADDMGRTVTLESRPERLVSLSPGNTEILFALGLGDKVVGVDDYSDYPPKAAEVPKVGGFSNPNVEKIVALQPDLVLATNMHEQAVRRLEEVGIPVAVVSPKTVEGVLESIEWIGKMTGAGEGAARLVADLRGRMQKVEAVVKEIPREKRPWVYYEVYSDPLMTAGPQTLIGQLIELAGGRNIAYDAQADYPEFSVEAIIERNPEVIIFPQWHGSESLTVEQVKSRNGWQQVRAIKNNRVFGVDANIISRPGPRIVEALEVLAKIIHPELFEEPAEPSS
ncbi:ABC transporter substrate-binding protein [Thermanaeromonas sp. C210]|uniref:ABC transporter substrate-binding protein n=1 Tax=Thermanaeromonas sp. C210 TaxID=2731925 RepID=UPI00155D32C7|nr:cobalamin-binding protein [Thermanaeromonas sp. C210]GFN23909.1 ABC transporter substrate-binding protein [Thermanaeromonas sp. C210]